MHINMFCQRQHNNVARATKAIKCFLIILQIGKPCVILPVVHSTLRVLHNGRRLATSPKGGEAYAYYDYVSCIYIHDYDMRKKQ